MDACKVKLVVVDSKCDFYKKGDEIHFDGPLLDVSKGGNFCMTALQGVYPFIFAGRQGALWDHVIQCPDCDERVAFKIEKDE